MNPTPGYVIHEVHEKEITVDWFYGPGHPGKKLAQLVLIVIAWFFLVLPVVVTASAIANRDNPDKGWWKYTEGFYLWDATIAFLTVFLVLFIVGYLVLYWLNRRSLKERNARATFDAERLSKRLEIADAMYARKYGPVADRLGQANVVIQPYADIETYELRGLYRQYEVED